MLPTDLSRLPKAIELVIHQMVHNLRLADVHRQLLGYVQVHMVDVREMVADAWEEWGLIGNPRALMPEKYAPGGDVGDELPALVFHQHPQVCQIGPFSNATVGTREFAKSVHSRTRTVSLTIVSLPSPQPCASPGRSPTTKRLTASFEIRSHQANT